MRIKLFTLTIIVFVGLQLRLDGQDIHFSQFHMSPLTTNPGLTGNFLGTMRLGGIYRSQWGGILAKSYRTPSFYIDAPVIRGFRKQDWVGAGGVLYQDQAGAGNLTTGGLWFSAAYHLGLGKTAKRVLSVGLQYGIGQKQVNDIQNLRFFDGIENGGSSLDEANISGDNTRYTDVNVGIVYTQKLTGDDRIHGGISAAHVSRGRATVLSAGGGGFRLPLRFVGYAAAETTMRERFKVRPAVQFQYMDSQYELLLQAIGGYVISPEEQLTLLVGLGYRLQDAVIPYVGVDYKTFKVGLAYDLNASKLGAGTAFELAVSYIVRVVKKPTVKPVIFCPRF